MVHDIDRPDVNGTPPKMRAVAEKAKEVLEGMTPVMNITTDDNLGSSVSIRGAFNPKEKWYNGIFQNGKYFIIFIWPEKRKRYYEEGEKVTIELSDSSHNLKKMRKYTGPLDKAIPKIATWIEQNKKDLKDYEQGIIRMPTYAPNVRVDY